MPLSIADDKIINIRVEENNEELVDCSNIKEILTDHTYYIQCLDLNSTTHNNVRKTITEKLCAAQSLMPSNWNIKLIEGYRSPRIQKLLFDNFSQNIKKHNGNLSDKELFYKTIEIVSPVNNLDGSKNIFPHGTGAAVDIKIFDNDGSEIDLGKFPEEDSSIPSKLFMTDCQEVSKQQFDNRQKLCQIMEQVGFVNYPYEWWHYSYGDRYWAYMKNKSNAIYNLIEV